MKKAIFCLSLLTIAANISAADPRQTGHLTSEQANQELIRAARIGDQEQLTELLEVPNININARSLYGETILMVAVLYDRPEIVKQLLDKGAKVNLQDNNGNTALMIAAREDHKKIVEHLLRVKGINVNVKNDNSNTALMIAARLRHREIVRLLLEAGANIHLTNRNNETALDIAEQKGNDAIVEQIKQKIRKEAPRTLRMREIGLPASAGRRKSGYVKRR